MTAEIQLALGHTEDCELDDKQRGGGVQCSALTTTYRCTAPTSLAEGYRYTLRH